MPKHNSLDIISGAEKPKKTIEELFSSFSFASFLSQQQRKHLSQLSHFLTKDKEKEEQGKEKFQNFLKVSQNIFTHFEKDMGSDHHKEKFLSLLMSWFRSKEAPKSGEGEMMDASFYIQLIEDSLNEYLHNKGIENLSDFLDQDNCPSFAFLVEEHHKKKKMEFAGESGPVGKIILDNLSFRDKDGKLHENVFLVKAESEDDLVRATRYASEQSHVCIGDEGQSYRKKLNKSKEENGIEVYFLWEGNVQNKDDGGRYLQIITYNKKSKKIEQMKGYDNHMITNDTDYLPALFQSLSFLSEKREIKSVTDTSNYRLKDGKVLTLQGEKDLDELAEEDFVMKGETLNIDEIPEHLLEKVLSTKGMKVKIDNMNDCSLGALKLLNGAKAEIEMKNNQVEISQKIDREKALIFAQIEEKELRFTTSEAVKSFFHEGVKEVRGNIVITGNEAVELPYLKSVGGYLNVRNAQTFSAPNLKSVKRGLDARNATSFSAPHLESVDGYLDARNATSFYAPNL